MESLRKNIIMQVESLKEGKIFTFKSLKFEPQKKSNVAVVLSELAKSGKVVRVEKGTYFRPKPSLLGLKHRPLSHQEKLDFISNELNGYITGPYIFNQMQLTEQVPMVVTIATPKPVRKFEKMNISFECVKSYIDNLEETNIYHLRLLDAIKSIRVVPGTTPSDVYSRLLNHHFKNIQLHELRKINELALSYPPRVRRIMMDICRDLGHTNEMHILSLSLNSNTHFKTTFENIKL